MSAETVSLENKFSEYCDKHIYKGFSIKKYVTKKDQELFGDKCLYTAESTINLDEKAASYLHPNMVIELIQDVKTKDMGWFFSLQKCDRIVYGYYDGSASAPSRIYRVDWKKCHDYVIELMVSNDSLLRYGTTDKYYGLTLNCYLPWKHLCEKEIAEKISLGCRICGKPARADGLCDGCFCTEEGWLPFNSERKEGNSATTP